MQMALEYLQGETFHNLSVKPVPVLSYHKVKSPPLSTGSTFFNAAQDSIHCLLQGHTILFVFESEMRGKSSKYCELV